MLIRALHFARGEEGKIPNGHSPLSQFLLFGMEFAAFDRFERELHRFAGAQDFRGDWFPDRQAGGQAHEVGHLLVVTDVGFIIAELKEQIPRLQSGPRRRRIRDHAADEHAGLAIGMFEQRLRIDAEPASLHLPVSDQLIRNAFGQVARNRPA